MHQGYIFIRMELEQDSRPVSLAEFDDEKLIQLVIRTFRGRTQAEVKEAEQLVTRSLNTPGIMEKFISMLTASTEPHPNFKKTVAIIIKKYSYESAKLDGDKSQLMNNIYDLLMSKQVEFAAKDVLGTALEHLITGSGGNYRQALLENVLRLLSGQNGLQNFDGSLIALNTIFNSLKEIEDQLDFFNMVVQLVCGTSMNLLKQILKIPFETWLAGYKPILDKLTKLFSFIQIMMENIFDYADEYPDQIQSIRQDPNLLQLFQHYLLLFHNNYSIVSRQFDKINELKRVIMGIVVTIYKLTECPLNIFKLVFGTFISQSSQMVNDFEVEAILIKCIEVLDDGLERKEYISYFIEKQFDVMFALMIYSATNLEEYQLIEEGPEKFVQIAEDYTECNMRSDYLKVKAGSMLQIFVEKVDEALKSVVNISLMMANEVLVPETKQAVPHLRQNFGRYMFYQLSDELKLQTILMVLCNLSIYIVRRRDLEKMVSNFFVSHFKKIISIRSHLVVLRIMRSISYYPSAIFFLYLEAQFTQGKTFILEGIKSFQRILKANKYPQLLNLLSKILINLMDVMKISDPIMQLIIINYYDSMLRQSEMLYFRCRQKIKEEFYANKDTNQHATYICFNLISALLKKEKDEERRNQIIAIFYEITEHLVQKVNLTVYKKYEEKLFEVFDLIVDIKSFTSPEIESFVQRSMEYLSSYSRGSVVFKLYNNYICKMEGAVFKLESCFQKFWEEVKERVKLYLDGADCLSSIAYYCFLMSQIIGSNMQVNLSSQSLDQLLTVAAKLPKEHRQYPLIVFLSFAHEMPHQAVEYLINKGIYKGFLEEVTKVEFEGQLPKKIIILALIRLIELEQNFQTFRIIMVYCVSYLKLQNKKSKRGPPRVTTYETRPRRLGQQRLRQNQQVESDQQNDNEMTNIFVSFKHPYKTLSEYDNFKVILTHRHGFLNQLDQRLIGEIKSILETKWVDNKTRRIISVVK